ncbi:TraR/DksA family transcriptional regulator [Aquabacterium sp. J223]|uniref:TraR/DksA family transcriptional regulator n=1 Tax=Aquabacterium sp. J223 TaxID=2898431 RepID=UPI0021AE09F4|nr:TraR/DksA family transcriptional regulator [Aquabacterium sp. J223]UUX94309.1 TraR/DksA family transcriptional regulator [Aquabacterium sp. J223]
MALNETDISTLKQRLTDRQRELGEEVRGAHEAQEDQRDRMAGEVLDSGESAEVGRRADVGHAEAERDVAEALDVQQALERIERGEYGDCTDCGMEIPVERLRVQPAAARCIDCQQAWERTHAVTATAAGHPLMQNR